MQSTDRKLYYITAAFTTIALVYLALNQYFKNENVRDSMLSQGMAVENVWVYKSETVINNETKMKAKSYKVSFDDLKLSKHCKGFYTIQKDSSVITDLTCE